MDKELPVVSIVVISNRNKCPPNYVPILKTSNGADADLYKDFALWAKTCRYLAVSRRVHDPLQLEVITDLLIISAREAIPANFISIDFTIDSNEKALRKKFLCARFTPRNNTLDAVTDIIVLNKSKRPPKGYSSAGEVDGFIICFKVATIPETYVKPNHNQSFHDKSYSHIPHNRSLTAGLHRHSTTDLEVFGGTKQFNNLSIHLSKEIRGIDGVPFKLRHDLENTPNYNDAAEMSLHMKLLSSPCFRFLQTSRASSSQFNPTKWHTVTLKNGVVASWHPEKEFPYKYTRPIDLESLQKQREEEEEQRKLDQTVRRSRDKEYGPAGPDNLALRRIFHAGKTEFVGRNQMVLIKALWFGRQKYLRGLAIQEQLFEKLNKRKHQGVISEHYLCLFEHYPTYTVGLRGHLYSEEEEARLKSIGAEFHRIKRGGMITYHGPGQLVAYPVFDLRTIRLRENNSRSGLSLGVKAFVNSVEEVLIQLLTDDYRIPGVSRTEDTGVWVDGYRKIAAIGIQVRHGITSHGLALNCNTDLSWFDLIVPCGLEGKESTSITKELSREVSIDNVIGPFCRKFEKLYDCQVELVSEVPQLEEEIAC
ncbi:hypothetical protein FO519_001119 [Halicephalobus sp. NKZ332]|nr:hypothetical protein FO519_001119 [Halicephalobus sp. NKZ332]